MTQEITIDNMYVFQPGTKAKAEEVNANFEAIKQGVKSVETGGAKKTGDKTVNFETADPTENFHAANKGYVDTLKGLIKSINTRFSVNSGNLNDNKKADLLSYSGSTLSFKVGGENYPSLSCTTAGGDNFTLKTLQELDVSGTQSGVYYVAVQAESETAQLVDKVCVQPSEPLTPSATNPVMTSAVLPEGAVTGTGGEYPNHLYWHGFSNEEIVGLLYGAAWSTPSGSTTYTYADAKRPEAGKYKISFNIPRNATGSDAGRSLNNSVFTITYTDGTTQTVGYPETITTKGIRTIDNIILTKQVKSITYSHSGSSVSTITLPITDIRLYKYVEPKNTIWMDTSFEPFQSKIYDGTSWVASGLVPIGSIKIDNGLIKEASTNTFNSLTEQYQSGLYTTVSRTADGTQWAVEYFTDPAKKNRAWIRQGLIGNSTTTGSILFTFLKPMSDTNYNINITTKFGINLSAGLFANKTTSSVEITTRNSSNVIIQADFSCVIEGA